MEYIGFGFDNFFIWLYCSSEYHVIVWNGMIPPSQVVSYWRWPNRRNRSNNKKTFKIPKMWLSMHKKIYWKSWLFSITEKKLIGWRRGSFQIVRLNEPRIRHHAPNCHHFRYIRLQFTSVRHIMKKIIS